VPLACPWVTHPLKERIAMLKANLPGRIRRLIGFPAVAMVMVGIAATVYAAQQPAHGYQPSKAEVAQALSIDDGAKTAVAEFMFSHDFHLPPNNGEAGLAEPRDFHQYAAAIRTLEVTKDGIEIDLQDAKGNANGSLHLVPHVDADRKFLEWSCMSDDIPGIQALEPACQFTPSAIAMVSAAGTFTLELHATESPHPDALNVVRCVKVGEYARIAQGSGADAWSGGWKVRPVAQGVEIDGELSHGGRLLTSPRIVAKPGKEVMMTLGKRVSVDEQQQADSAADAPGISMTLRATPGCAIPG
jgi:hypothetical protein